jgi:DNA-directed RNA polymerase III subunit RPC4
MPQPLEALQDGLLGQLFVYASGAVKLRVGEVMFDVMPGASLTHSEQVAALNCSMHRCAFLGAAKSRVVVTPDVDLLLDDADGLAV